MSSAADRALVALASRQGGMVAFAQVLEAGLSPSAATRRVASGEWARVRPRVYRLRALPPDRAGPLWSAVLSAPGTVVAGRSAAWWHGLLDAPPAMPEIVVPRRSTRVLIGVRSVRSDLDPLDLTTRRGLPLVTRGLAVLQSVATLRSGGVELLDRALQGGVAQAELSSALERWRRHRGSAFVNLLMRAAADGAASEAERIAHSLLRSGGLHGWIANHPVGRAVIDIAFVEQRVAVEVDGWAWHHDHERFQRDRKRQNALVLGGWTVLRFTWADLTDDPGRVLATLGSALER